jgi:hypothetical protein
MDTTSLTFYASSASVLALGLSYAGCTPGEAQGILMPDRDSRVEIRWGRVATEDLVIESTDGSFALKTGMTFDTPFHAHDCPTIVPTTYREALRVGARPVVVRISGHVLHGVLTFCRVDRRATGPSARSHLIEVPMGFVQATSEDKISVVFDTVGEAPTWALWLSETPLR